MCAVPFELHLHCLACSCCNTSATIFFCCCLCAPGSCKTAARLTGYGPLRTLVYHSNLNLQDADEGPEPILPIGPNAKLPNDVINSIAQRDINPDQPYDLMLVAPALAPATDNAVIVMASTEPFYLHAIDRKVVPVKFDCSQTGAYNSTRVWNVNLKDAKESWIQNWANEDQPGKQHAACKDNAPGMRLQWWFNGKDSMEPDKTDFGITVKAPFLDPFPVTKFAPTSCGHNRVCPAFSHPGGPGTPKRAEGFAKEMWLFVRPGVPTSHCTPVHCTPVRYSCAPLHSRDISHVQSQPLSNGSSDITTVSCFVPDPFLNLLCDV